MDNKNDKMETYGEGLTPIELHNSFNTRSRQVMWQIKYPIHNVYGHQTWLFAEHLHDLTMVTWEIYKFISPLSQYLWLLNLGGCWLQGRCSEHKRLCRHRPFVFFPFFLLIAVFGRTDKCCSYFFFYFWFRGVWPISDSLTWYTMCFQAMCFRQG